MCISSLYIQINTQRTFVPYTTEWAASLRDMRAKMSLEEIRFPHDFLPVCQALCVWIDTQSRQDWSLLMASALSGKSSVVEQDNNKVLPVAYSAARQ